MINLLSPRRTRQEDIVPMINVAFLLLVFFLMSAVIAPPAPVDIAAPNAQDTPGDSAGARLFVGPGGAVVAEDGQVVLNFGEYAGRPVAIAADASLPAATFVRIVEQLRAAGVAEIQLVARHNFK